MAGDYGSAISLSRDISHTSDDSSSDQSPRSVPTLSTPSSSSKPRTTSQHLHHHNIQSPVEIQRKPRGRPPGSKNKPKPPIIITKDTNSTMKPTILEISAGSDIINSIINFARKNHAGGITVISATGTVSNVTLRHPISHAPSLSLHGPFNLLALSGSFLGSLAPNNNNNNNNKQSSSSSPCCFGISLAGAQGQVFGGIVAGKVMAASQVVVVAATFLNPTFYSLPSSDNDEGEETKPNIGGENSSCTGMSKCVYGVANPTPINCQISPDVMHWGPPPPPPPRPSHY